MNSPNPMIYANGAHYSTFRESSPPSNTSGNMVLPGGDSNRVDRVTGARITGVHFREAPAILPAFSGIGPTAAPPRRLRIGALRSLVMERVQNQLKIGSNIRDESGNSVDSGSDMAELPPVPVVGMPGAAICHAERGKFQAERFKWKSGLVMEPVRLNTEYLKKPVPNSTSANEGVVPAKHREPADRSKLRVYASKVTELQKSIDTEKARLVKVEADIHRYESSIQSRRAHPVPARALPLRATASPPISPVTPKEPADVSVAPVEATEEVTLLKGSIEESFIFDDNEPSVPSVSRTSSPPKSVVSSVATRSNKSKNAWTPLQPIPLMDTTCYIKRSRARSNTICGYSNRGY